MEKRYDLSFHKELLMRGLAERTIKEYLYYLSKLPQGEITTPILYDFLEKNPNGPARSFAKNYADHIGLLDYRSPRRTGRKPKRIINIMTESEYTKLRIALYKRAPRWGLMFDLTYWLGLRREEICTLAIDWFEWDSYKKDKPTRIRITGKGSKQRLAIVPGWLMEPLIQYMHYRANQGITESQPLFGIGTHYWWRVFTTMSERHLGKHYRPHEIRHTRTVLWRRNDVTIDQVSKRLGHSSVAVTEHYWNLDPEEVALSWEKELEEGN